MSPLHRLFRDPAAVSGDGEPIGFERNATGVSDESAVAGVLGTLAVLRLAATDTTGVYTIWTAVAPVVYWVLAAVGLDLLASFVDERTYFRLDVRGWYPLMYRTFLPPIVYFTYLLNGGDESFKRLLALGGWASGPLLLPAAIDAALHTMGLSTPLVVWLGGGVWAGVLWTRALASARDVPVWYAAAAVTLLCSVSVYQLGLL